MFTYSGGIPREAQLWLRRAFEETKEVKETSVFWLVFTIDPNYADQIAHLYDLQVTCLLKTKSPFNNFYWAVVRDAFDTPRFVREAVAEAALLRLHLYSWRIVEANKNWPKVATRLDVDFRYGNAILKAGWSNETLFRWELTTSLVSKSVRQLTTIPYADYRLQIENREKLKSFRKSNGHE